MAKLFPARLYIYTYTHTHTHTHIYIYSLSGFLPFRILFPVSNLFISQDPTLSYLHVHCKCNVNESSDKIFLYFVISKEFLYRRTQWSLACTSSIVFWVVLQGGPGPLFFFFPFLFSIQICYMSVRPFSKDFIQFGFLWLKKNSQITCYTQNIWCSIHLKEPSLSLLPPSVESLLYKVVVIFFFYNCQRNFCQLEKPTSVSQVPWKMPSPLETLTLLTIDLSCGENKSDCAWCRCVMSAWHCFECGIISWCSFPGLYYPLSFTKADRTAALAWQPVVLSANELQLWEIQARKVPRGSGSDGAF